MTGEMHASVGAVDDLSIDQAGTVLCDTNQPMKLRFRALFSLRHAGGERAIKWMTKALLTDQSALLKHEVAYLFGQMQDKRAATVLIQVLSDENENPMVRHECGEALGNLGVDDAFQVLEKFAHDSAPEVAETCQIALDKIKWIHENPGKNPEEGNPFASVDPAPADGERNIDRLQAQLVDVSLSLFDRYRAMFALRNIGGDSATKALAAGLACTDSALFRHEIAYVLGQLQNSVCVPELLNNLKQNDENPMVRHECVEALGSIAQPTAVEELKMFVTDKDDVVRESCEVALDMAEYETSLELDYAKAH